MPTLDRLILAAPACPFVTNHRVRRGAMQTERCLRPMRSDWKTEEWVCPLHPEVRMTWTRAVMERTGYGEIQEAA